MLRYIVLPLMTFGSVFVTPLSADFGTGAAITGELKTWHKVTVTIDGPRVGEMNVEPNPFTDYRLTATFSHESGETIHSVPEYFAADGNAGETGANSGTKWRAHFSPDRPGKWKVKTVFVSGKNVAIDGGKTISLKSPSQHDWLAVIRAMRE